MMDNKVAAKADWTKAAALGNQGAVFSLAHPPVSHKNASKSSSASTSGNWAIWKN
jgi:hypothetical protein